MPPSPRARAAAPSTRKCIAIPETRNVARNARCTTPPEKLPLSPAHRQARCRYRPAHRPGESSPQAGGGAPPWKPPATAFPEAKEFLAAVRNPGLELAGTRVAPWRRALLRCIECEWGGIVQHRAKFST